MRQSAGPRLESKWIAMIECLRVGWPEFVSFMKINIIHRHSRNRRTRNETDGMCIEDSWQFCAQMLTILPRCVCVFVNNKKTWPEIGLFKCVYLIIICWCRLPQPAEEGVADVSATRCPTASMIIHLNSNHEPYFAHIAASQVVDKPQRHKYPNMCTFNVARAHFSLVRCLQLGFARKWCGDVIP